MPDRRLALIDQVVAAYRARLITLEAGAASRARRDARLLRELLIAQTTRTLTSASVRDAYQALIERRVLERELDQLVSNLPEFRRLEQAAQAYGDAYARAAVQAISDARVEAMQQAQRFGNSVAVVQAPSTVAAQVAGVIRLVPVEKVANLVAAGDAASPLFSLASMGAESSGRVLAAMIEGAARGESSRTVARRVASTVTDAADWQVLRVTRTEMARAARTATDAWMAENASVVGEWVWHAKLDGATCAACWAMHGTTHKVGESMGTHPNCRCAQLPRPKSPAELGFANVPDDRPTIETGEDVFAGLPASTQAQILGPKKYEAYAAGQIRLGDVVKRSESDAWGITRGVGSLEHAKAQAASRGAVSTTTSRKRATTTQTVASTNNISVSYRLQSGTSRARFDDAVAVVERLHSPKISLDFFGPKTGARDRLGAYWPNSQAIAVKPHVSATRNAVHEIGHAVDFQLYGGNRRGSLSGGSTLATEDSNHPLRAWWDAVEATNWRKRVDDAFPSGNSIKEKRYNTYLKDPEEVWARTYEQWVSLRSGRDDLVAMRSASDARYWPDDEFAAIAVELDKLLL